MTCYESHPDLDALELQLIGQLSEPDNAEVKKHVLMCAPCQEMARALNQHLEPIRAALKLDLTRAAYTYRRAETEPHLPIEV